MYAQNAPMTSAIDVAVITAWRRNHGTAWLRRSTSAGVSTASHHLYPLSPCIESHTRVLSVPGRRFSEQPTTNISPRNNPANASASAKPEIKAPRSGAVGEEAVTRAQLSRRIDRKPPEGLRFLDARPLPTRTFSCIPPNGCGTPRLSRTWRCLLTSSRRSPTCAATTGDVPSAKLVGLPAVVLGAAAVLDLSPCGATIGVLGEDSALTADVGASILTSSLSATGQKVATLARCRTAFWLERLVPARILDGLGVRRRKFEKAAKSGVWSMTGESVSGAGSSLQATERLRAVLPHVLREFEVRTLLDAPCGDWNWMSHVDLPVERYIGGDIVRALVDENRLRHGSPERDFRVIDLCVDPLRMPTCCSAGMLSSTSRSPTSGGRWRTFDGLRSSTSPRPHSSLRRSTRIRRRVVAGGTSTCRHHRSSSRSRCA